MAQFGTFGTVMTTANTYVLAGAVNTGIAYATISVNLVNTSATADTTVRIAIVPTGVTVTQLTTDLASYKKYHIEFGANLTANGGVLERTCIPVSPGEQVFVWAASGDVAATRIRSGTSICLTSTSYIALAFNLTQ
jgi:hypothetical protein